MKMMTMTLCYPWWKVKAISKMLWRCSRNITQKFALKSRNFSDFDLRNVLLLYNQLTFDLCCNKTFVSKIFKRLRMLS